jgi:endo-1,4-beta-xylanase
MSRITRRQGLGMAMSAAALAVAPRALALTPVLRPSLNDLAVAKGMRFGSCIAAGGGGSFANPRYAAVVEHECGLLVPENELKWQAIRPSAAAFDFKRCDTILDDAARRNIPVRGHTLLWHRSKWMPAWMETHDFGARPATAAATMMTSHVETVLARYKGRMASIDVVNETVMPEDGALAQTALSTAIGGTETLVDLAFRTARAAAPALQLVYNDYMSWEPGNEQHRKGVLKLLEGFRKRGTPVDALGVQSHLIAGRKPQERAWRDFVDAVTAMGYDLLITEFDVRDADLPADISNRDAAIAAESRAYLDMMFGYPRLRDVLAWGMADPFSWLQGFEPRADGLPTRGCLYDAAFAAKPLRDAVAAAFRSAAIRT